MMKNFNFKTIAAFCLSLAGFTANAQDEELFLNVSSFDGGFNSVVKLVDNSRRACVVDANGNKVTGYDYTGISPFSCGLAIVNKPVVDEGGRQTTMIGYIDTTGNEVIPCQYARVSLFSEDGLALVTTPDSKHFLINTKGERIVQIKANFIDYTIKNGFFPYSDDKKTWGFMNVKGEKLTSSIYDYAFLSQMQWGGFADYLAVRRGGRWGLIDRKGKEILECQYGDIVYPKNLKSGSVVFVKVGMDIRSPYKMIKLTDM